MKAPTMRSPRMRKAVFGAYLLLTTLYLVWRVGFTINTKTPVYSGLFLVAELYAILTACIFYVLVIGRRKRRPPPPEADLRVDIFIATYDEEVDLVRQTAVAARDVEGPHRTWICDDGRREEMKELADELGVGYLTRDSNEDHKAGNLNHALACTDGDLVITLDADHVLRRQFLERTLGYFRDPTVALVQTPQVYYNVDSYQHVVSTRKRRFWHEASIFHHAMQPGADRLNCAFFVGTGAVLRRSALEPIGGFATGSITEDIHTSLRLHAAGHRSVYLDEALGFLLAPDTPVAYTVQRLRWAQGAMQILRRENPLRKPGLSFWQRICYWNSLFGYLGAFPYLIFYLAPGLLLLGGPSPIALDRPYALWGFTAHIVFDIAIFRLLAGRQGRLFFTECFKVLNVSIFLRASLTLFQPDSLPFKVTPKGRHQGLPLSMLAPVIFVFAFNLTAVGLGVTQLLQGTLHVGAVFLSMFFAGLFAAAGALALLHSFERKAAGEDFPFPLSESTGFRVLGGRFESVVTVVRMNARVAYVRTDRVLPAAGPFGLDLRFAGIDRMVRVEMEGAHREAGRKNDVILKLRMLDLEALERDALSRYLFGTAFPRFLAHFPDAPKGPAPDVSGLTTPRPGSQTEDGPMEEFVTLRTGVV